MSWLVPALIGLAGVLIATGFAYAQWKKSESRKSSSRFNNVRAEALNKLLQKLQDLEIKSRAKTVSQEDLEREVRSVNELLIMNRLTLTEEDGVEAHAYLNSVTEIHKVISGAPHRTRESWDWTWPIFEDDEVVSYYFQRLTEASDYLQKEILKSLEDSES